MPLHHSLCIGACNAWGPQGGGLKVLRSVTTCKPLWRWQSPTCHEDEDVSDAAAEVDDQSLLDSRLHIVLLPWCKVDTTQVQVE